MSQLLNSKNNQRIVYYLTILINLVITVIIFATIDDKQIYTYFNSDTLYLPSIYKDIFIDKSGFEGWHLNGAPNLLPDMLLFFIVRSFFSHFIPACFAFSLIQLTILITLLTVLYKTIFKEINYFHLSFATLLMSMFLLVTLVSKDFVYTFYLLSISYHLGAFMMLLISLILLFTYIKSGKNSHLVILFILSIISIINDRLYLIMFSFPLYSLIFALFLPVDKKRRYLKILLLNTLSICFGLFLFRMLKLSGYIHIIGLSWKVFNFDNIMPSLRIFLEQHTYYLKEFDFRGIINLLFLTSFATHTYMLVKNFIRIQRKKPLDELEFIYLLLIVPALFIILVTPILNGSYVSWALLRYNIYSLYLGIFSLAFVLYKLNMIVKLLPQLLPLTLILVILLESGFIITTISKQNIAEGLRDFMSYYPDKVKCIDDKARQKGLKFGVAEYWNAKYITMFSKEDIRVYTVLNNLSIWYHVMNENWYYKEGKGKFGDPTFTFVISNRIDTESILEHLGPAKDTIHCNDHFELLHYPEFQFDHKTRKPSIVK